MNLQPNTKKLVSNINYKTIEIEEIINFLNFLGLNKYNSNKFSLYQNKNILIRDVIHSNNYGEYIDIKLDIFFLKLAKLGLLDIELYNIKIHLDTKEGKEAYKFMNKYILKGDNYINSETGKTKYNIEEILKNEKTYNTFIKHIFSSILKNDEINNFFDEDIFENLIEMKVELKNIKDFFEGISKIFIKKSEKIRNYLNKKLIKEYKSENNYIEFKINEYFNNYTYIFFLLNELEKSGKLKIKDVIIYSKMKGELGKTYIKFELEKYVNEISPIFLEDIKVEKKNQYRTKYKKGGFYIDGNLYKKEAKTKISDIIKIIFKYREEFNKSEFSYIELVKYFKNNEKDYPNFYNFINKNNQYENIKEKKPDEINNFLLKKIFNKEYFKGSLGGRNNKKDIFICKKYNTGILI